MVDTTKVLDKISHSKKISTSYLYLYPTSQMFQFFPPETTIKRSVTMHYETSQHSKRRVPMIRPLTSATLSPTTTYLDFSLNTVHHT